MSSIGGSEIESEIDEEFEGLPLEAFDGEVDEILVCSICGKVAEQPHECPCGHLFCGVHIRQWLSTGNLTCPTCRAVTTISMLKEGADMHLAYRRQLADLRLKCPYAGRGCTELMPPDAYRPHTKHCPYAPVVCKWKGCPSHNDPKMRINRMDLKAHQQQCDYRTIACTFHGCGRTVQASQMVQHRQECQDVVVLCPLKGCQQSVTRGTLDHHIENPVLMAEHLRLLVTQVAELERPQLVDSELVLRIPDMAERLENQDFSFWSATHTLRVAGLGNGGYNFQLAVALKPPQDGRSAVLAMFLHIKPGEFDELLPWPFPIPFTLAVLDQDRPPLHLLRKIDNPTAQVANTTYLRPGGGGWGYPSVTPLDRLKERGYIKDGIMFVRIVFHTDGVDLRSA